MVPHYMVSLLSIVQRSWGATALFCARAAFKAGAFLCLLLFTSQVIYADDPLVYFGYAFNDPKACGVPFDTSELQLSRMEHLFDTQYNILGMHGAPELRISPRNMALLCPCECLSGTAPHNILMSCQGAQAYSKPSMIEQVALYSQKPTTGFRSVICPSGGRRVAYLQLLTNEEALENSPRKILNQFVQYDPITNTCRFGGNPFEFGFGAQCRQIVIQHAKGNTVWYPEVIGSHTLLRNNADFGLFNWHGRCPPSKSHLSFPVFEPSDFAGLDLEDLDISKGLSKAGSQLKTACKNLAGGYLAERSLESALHPCGEASKTNKEPRICPGFGCEGGTKCGKYGDIPLYHAPWCKHAIRWRIFGGPPQGGPRVTGVMSPEY